MEAMIQCYQTVVARGVFDAGRNQRSQWMLVLDDYQVAINASVQFQDIRDGIWRRHTNAKPVMVAGMIDEYLQAAIAMIKRGYDSHGQAVPQDRDMYLPMLEAEAIRRGLQPAEDGWDK